LKTWLRPWAEKGGRGRKERDGEQKREGLSPPNTNPGYGRHWCSAQSQQSSDVAYMYVAEQIVVCCSEDRKLITVITHTAAAAAAALAVAVAAVCSRWRDESTA